MDIIQSCIPRRGGFNLDKNDKSSSVICWDNIIGIDAWKSKVLPTVQGQVYTTQRICQKLPGRIHLFFASPYLPIPGDQLWSWQIIHKGLLVQQQAPISWPRFCAYALKSLPHSGLLFGFSSLSSCHLMLRISA